MNIFIYTGSGPFIDWLSAKSRVRVFREHVYPRYESQSYATSKKFLITAYLSIEEYLINI